MQVVNLFQAHDRFTESGVMVLATSSQRSMNTPLHSIALRRPSSGDSGGTERVGTHRDDLYERYCHTIDSIGSERTAGLQLKSATHTTIEPWKK